MLVIWPLWLPIADMFPELTLPLWSRLPVPPARASPMLSTPPLTCCAPGRDGQTVVSPGRSDHPVRSCRVSCSTPPFAVARRYSRSGCDCPASTYSGGRPRTRPRQDSSCVGRGFDSHRRLSQSPGQSPDPGRAPVPCPAASASPKQFASSPWQQFAVSSPGRRTGGPTSCPHVLRPSCPPWSARRVLAIRTT